MDPTEADASNLASFLKDNSLRFCVPFFQRQYAWGKDQLDRFWDDVAAVIQDGDSERNFLGAFVLQPKTSKALGPTEMIVIDGQQRLTTIFLTLLACAEYADEHGWQDWRYSDVQRPFFECQERSVAGLFKLEPTPLDRRQFNEIFKRFDDKKIKPFDYAAGRVEGRISETYEECCRRLKGSLTSIGDPKSQSTLDEFLERFLGNTEIVFIELDRKRNAHDIFDRLNNAGAKLRIIDLVRNEVFQRVETNQDKLFHEEWEPFEKQLHDAFVGIKDEKKRAEAIDNFFWPYALIHNQNATKTKLYSSLQEAWMELTDDDPIGFEAASLIIEDLTLWLPAYFALKIGRKPDGIDDDLWARIEVINDMPVHIITYPYLMPLIRLHCEHPKKYVAKDCIKCIEIIEGFFVRRAVAGFEPSGLHVIFKALWNRAGTDPAMVRKKLETRTIVIPDDKAFRENILGLGLYGRSLAGFILRRYEESLWAEKREAFDRLPPSTIDHVMPEARAGQWTRDVTAEDHHLYKDTWGNLVLMSQGLNSLKGNKGFDVAKKIIKDHSVFKSAREVLSSRKWGVSQIKTRGAKIADWAIKNWPV